MKKVIERIIQRNQDMLEFTDFWDQDYDRIIASREHSQSLQKMLKKKK